MWYIRVIGHVIAMGMDKLWPCTVSPQQPGASCTGCWAGADTEGHPLLDSIFVHSPFACLKPGKTKLFQDAFLDGKT